MADARWFSAYVARQLSAFYPDDSTSADDLLPAVGTALERHARCYGRVKLKGASAEVDHLHTDQYAAFLYFVASALFANGARRDAAKVYALNKALHALDVFYEVQLPDIFGFQHPVGTVIGRGQFHNYLFVYQRCSIGSNLVGEYPRFEEGVVMFGGAAVIGKCHIGPNSWLSVGTTVMDEDIPGDCVVFGRSPHLTIKKSARNVRRDIFGSY